MSWSVHACGWMSRDPTCRAYGVPRVYIQTPWGSLGIGITWDARMQLWLPWKVKNRFAEGGRSNYSDHIWSPVVWHPAERKR